MRRPPLTRLANRRNLFSITKFSFYALNVNCYSPDRECVRFFHFHVQREYSTVFYFVLRTFVWRFLAFYPFACGNTLQRFLHVFLGCFCTLSILQPFFLFFWWGFFLKWVLRVCLSDTRDIFFRHRLKTPFWQLDVCLSLIQVERNFFVNERSVCFIIQEAHTSPPVRRRVRAFRESFRRW